MKRHVCPRCGSSNVDWIIPQVWSTWECKDCSYTGPAIVADDDLVAEIKEDWEKNYQKYIKNKDVSSESIVSGEEYSDDEFEISEEIELSDEELDKKLKDLGL